MRSELERRRRLNLCDIIGTWYCDLLAQIYLLLRAYIRNANLPVYILEIQKKCLLNCFLVIRGFQFNLQLTVI